MQCFLIIVLICAASLFATLWMLAVVEKNGKINTLIDQCEDWEKLCRECNAELIKTRKQYTEFIDYVGAHMDTILSNLDNE